MTEKFLDGPDIIAGFKQIGPERVPEGMATGRFGKSSLTSGLLPTF